LGRPRRRTRRRGGRRSMIFIGDIHGNFKKLFSLINNSDVKNDTFIQVGDMGVGFRPFEDEYLLLSFINELLIEEGNDMLVIRGNHDNPAYFTEDLFKFSNIKFLPDFHVTEINGKTLLMVGGALSIDRIYRKEGVNYWKDEELPLIIPDIKNFYSENPIDIVCTHTCPSFTWPFTLSPIVEDFIKVDPKLANDLINERKRLDLLHEKVTDYNGFMPKNWVYGHMHKTIATEYKETKFQCCGIDELYELKFYT
jgi:hypothetical protein